MARVLVMGGVSWNILVFLERFPAAVPGNVYPRRVHEAVGSTGAGKALNLARLGVEIDLHATLGDDGEGRRVRAALEAGGVPFHATVDPAGTTRHLNLMDAGGERISVWLATGGVEPDVDPTQVEPLIAAADLVALNISSYCRRFIPTIQRLGRPIWTDLHDYDGHSPYHQAFRDAAEVVFFSDTALPDPRPLMRDLIAAGKRLAVCTHGADGATALGDDGRWLSVPAWPGALLVDSNGAGDAFFAGTLYGHLRGYPRRRCLELGAVVAGLCVGATELADPTMSADQVERLWQTHFGGRRAP